MKIVNLKFFYFRFFYYICIVKQLNKIDMKQFQFNYYGWLPGYNDFDDDQVIISAPSKEEAIKIFNSKKRWIKYGPEIIELKNHD